MGLNSIKLLLYEASRGHYGREMAISIRDATKASIDTSIPSKSIELEHTIHLTKVISLEIDEIESAITQSWIP